MVMPEKPDQEPNSEQADNIFNHAPNDLPPEARAIYEQAYMAFIEERGNNPELAHHSAMAAVQEQYEEEPGGYRWRRRKDIF